jgi:hypothetical protein
MKPMLVVVTTRETVPPALPDRHIKNSTNAR